MSWFGLCQQHKQSTVSQFKSVNLSTDEIEEVVVEPSFKEILKPSNNEIHGQSTDHVENQKFEAASDDETVKRRLKW